MKDNTLIRGFRNGLVRCPDHGQLYIWTAETDSGVYPTLEVVKYDCGCVYSWEAGWIGAPAMCEHCGSA